jgi:hypothetical protein
MSNSMPLRWIEQSEAREMLKAARFEQGLAPARRKLAVETAAELLGKLHDQLVAMAAAAMPAPQLMPARVRRVKGGRVVRGDSAQEWFERYR